MQVATGFLSLATLGHRPSCRGHSRDLASVGFTVVPPPWVAVHAKKALEGVKQIDLLATVAVGKVLAHVDASA